MNSFHRLLAVIACALLGFSVGAFTMRRRAPFSRAIDARTVTAQREISLPSENLVGQALACSGSNATLSDLAHLSEFLARFTSQQMGEYLDRLRAEAHSDQRQVAWVFGR